MWCSEAKHVFLGAQSGQVCWFVLCVKHVLFQLNVYPFPLQNEKKLVQMMFKKSTFNMTYIGEISTKILVLPYVGKELNMIIMLPDENVDLETVMSAKQ